MLVCTTPSGRGMICVEIAASVGNVRSELGPIIWEGERMVAKRSQVRIILLKITKLLNDRLSLLVQIST